MIPLVLDFTISAPVGQIGVRKNRRQLMRADAVNAPHHHESPMDQYRDHLGMR
jgi:hypothetical protein